SSRSAGSSWRPRFPCLSRSRCKSVINLFHSRAARAALCACSVLCVLSVVPLDAEAANRAGVRAYERRDYAKAIEKLMPEAERGDAAAQYYVAMSLREQLPKPKGTFRVRPVETDPAQQAVYGWLEKAAQQGHAEAQRELAEALDRGFGTPVDYQAALEWMQKAAESGDDRARRMLADWYRTGHIVVPDRAKADNLQKFAALEGGREGQGAIDRLRKLTEAIRQYQSALANAQPHTDEELAEAGDPGAALRLAEAARDNREGKQDCAAAAKWYERAAELGDASGFERLGT